MQKLEEVVEDVAKEQETSVVEPQQDDKKVEDRFTQKTKMDFKYNKNVMNQREIRLDANRQALEKAKEALEYDPMGGDPPTQTPTEWKSIDPLAKKEEEQNQDLLPLEEPIKTKAQPG